MKTHNNLMRLITASAILLALATINVSNAQGDPYAEPADRLPESERSHVGAGWQFGHRKQNGRTHRAVAEDGQSE